MAFFKLILNKNANTKCWHLRAERAGFEPAVDITTYVGLANRWFQPLTHLSVAAEFLRGANLMLCLKFASIILSKPKLKVRFE